MKDPTFENIAALVARVAGVPRERITASTSIEDDLGTTGDDAEELMEEFSKEFGVDLSRMDFYRHFSPEVWIPFYGFFFRRSRGYDMRSMPVTVQMLVDAARAHQWPTFSSVRPAT